MTFEKTFDRTIQDAFQQFHKNNPDVYSGFKTLAFKAIKAGKKKISSKAIINVLRWEFSFSVESTKFKINDAFTSRYARLFIKDYPEYKSRFELRALRAA